MKVTIKRLLIEFEWRAKRLVIEVNGGETEELINREGFCETVNGIVCGRIAETERNDEYAETNYGFVAEACMETTVVAY